MVQTTLTSRCPSPKRSWKDKIKGLLNRNAEESSVGDAWFQVDDKTSSSSLQNVEDNAQSSSTHQSYSNGTSKSNSNSFLNNEEYRVERSDDGIGGCEERARKLRVRSVDIEDEVPLDTPWTEQRRMYIYLNI